MSGINLGMNLGDDVTYSGTVAAALEGICSAGRPSPSRRRRSTVDADQWDGTAYDFRGGGRASPRGSCRVVSRATSRRGWC